MATALAKHRFDLSTTSEVRKRESDIVNIIKEFDRRLTKVIAQLRISKREGQSDIVGVVKELHQGLTTIKARLRISKREAESASQKFKNDVAALLGEQSVKAAHQRFLVEIAFEGEKIRLRKPSSSFPSTRVRVKYLDRTPADMLHAIKSAEGGAWKGDELQSQFDLTPATLHRRRKEHRMVYWRDAKHQFHYPKWQFTESGALISGLQEVLEAFKSPDEWRLMRYFLAPRHELGDRSPLTLLREGKKSDVIAHAKAHAEENTW